MVTFQPYENYPSLLSLPELKKLEKNKNMVVKTGFFIRSFLKFDVSKNDFECDGIVWFEFDESFIKLTDIEQFSFENGEIKQKSKPFITKNGTKTRARYDIQLQFKTMLDHKNFPLDDHRLALALVNHSEDARDVIFESDPTSFSYSSDMFLSGWKIIGHNVQYGFMKESIYADPQETHYYQKVVFLFDCMRRDIRHVATILIPLLLILFLTIFCFTFNIDRLFDQNGISDTHGQTILSIVLFSVSTLMAYRFVIESISPDVSYFILSDYIFFIFLIVTMIIFGLIAKPNKLTLSQKKLGIIALYAIVLVTCALLLW